MCGFVDREGMVLSYGVLFVLRARWLVCALGVWCGVVLAEGRSRCLSVRYGVDVDVDGSGGGGCGEAWRVVTTGCVIAVGVVVGAVGACGGVGRWVARAQRFGSSSRRVRTMGVRRQDQEHLTPTLKHHSAVVKMMGLWLPCVL